MQYALVAYLSPVYTTLATVGPIYQRYQRHVHTSSAAKYALVMSPLEIVMHSMPQVSCDQYVCDKVTAPSALRPKLVRVVFFLSYGPSPSLQPVSHSLPLEAFLLSLPIPKLQVSNCGTCHRTLG